MTGVQSNPPEITSTERVPSILEQAIQAAIAKIIDPMAGLDGVDRTKIENNPQMQAAELEKCRHDMVYWITNYCFTYDPRDPDPGNRSKLLNLWPRQIEMVQWMERKWLESQKGQVDCAIQKSRDSGVSCVCVAFALHKWLFQQDFKWGFGSYTEKKVDSLGDPDSLFEKLRIMIRKLPPWMKPRGLKDRDHLLQCRVSNPENGSIIIGEIGDNIGRGGRNAGYAVDEASFLEHPDLADAALTGNAPFRLDVSTPNGIGNWFFRKVHSLPPDNVFTFGWAQPLDAKILTPNGWDRMGNIQVGDLVIGVNGKPTPVIGIYPQGKKKVYKVSFNDGSSTECCADHLWSVIPYGNQREERKHIRKVKPLSELMKDYVSKDNRGFNRHRYQIPITGAVEFSNNVALPLNPYVLGCLIGDGSFPKKTVRPILLSTTDCEIVDHVNERLPNGCSMVHMDKITYRIAADESCRGGLNGRGLHNPVNKTIRSLGLSGTECHNKFVPHIYKTASPIERLELLQGMMDADGSACKSDPGAARFHTISQNLVEDVVFVVQSLGGVAKVSVASEPGLKIFPGNRKCFCQQSYMVTIRLPDGMIPFKLSRKANSYLSSKRCKVRRSLTGIEAAGVKVCQCIKVEAEDGLYLTDDFIVTHNTDDPRKNEEWKKAMIEAKGQIIFEREYNLNYAASLEGIAIPSEWVRAAVDLPLPATGDIVAGFDVADEGDNESVLAPRQGSVIHTLITWSRINTTQSAHTAARHLETMKATTVFYDAVGSSVKGTWDSMLSDQGEDAVHLPFETVPVVGQEAASKIKVWPDGKTSYQKFANIRAEMWWIVRTRFEKTYEYVKFQNGEEGGAFHELDELISIPNDQTLINQLSTPLIEYNSKNGKIQIESKVKMKQRGVKSPDRADALCYSFYPTDIKRKFWFI